MSNEGALLTLIVDDERALRVLAAWASMCPLLSDAANDSTLAQLALLANVSGTMIQNIVGRLVAARVLIDGGITELADKLLQTYVQSRLSGKKRK